MDCRHFDEYISPYLDQVLDEKEKDLFERHLNNCPECKKNLEDTRRLISILGDLGEEPLPQGFQENMFRKLEKLEDVQKPNGHYWLRWIGAIAGIIVMLFSIKAIKNPLSMGEMSKNSSPVQEMADEVDIASDMALHDESYIAMDDNVEAERGDYDEDAQDDSQSAAPKRAISEAENQYSNGIGSIQTDIVEVYVEDICITPQTLKDIAINNQFELIEADDNSVVIEMRDQTEREILYQELSKLGEIREVGQSTEENLVRIVIKNQAKPE